jgi:ubiquinone/menaquinone biosynthesis C-methylase UbiE
MEKIKVDLGCGNNKKKGFIGIDIAPLKQVDLVCDVEKYGIPFQTNSIDAIVSFHFLEHVENVPFVIKEIYRVLKRGGIAEIVVPHFSNIGAYHWSHKTYWNARGLDFVEKTCFCHYYCPSVNFRILKRNIEFSGKRNYSPTFFEKLINWRYMSTYLYETWLSSLFRAYQVRVVMKKRT